MEQFGVLVYMLIVLSILLYIKYRFFKIISLTDSSLMQAILEDAMESVTFRNGENAIIIWLDYDSTIYAEMDTLITKATDKLIIIFRAPEWLFKLKKRIWQQHIVLDGNRHKLIANKEGIIQKHKSGRLQYYDKPHEFLEYYNTKAKFLNRFEKIFSR